MTMRSPCRWSMLGSIVAGALLGCEEPDVAVDAEIRDGGLDASLQDSAPDVLPDVMPDALPDALPDGGRPDPVQHDFCDQAIFKFIDGTVDDSYGQCLSANGVAYWIANPLDYLHSPLKFLDLDSCLEYQVTTEYAIGSSSLYEHLLFYSKVLDEVSSPTFRMDLTTWQEEQVTFNDNKNRGLHFNGRQLLYVEWVYINGDPSTWRLMLTDIPSGDTTELAPYHTQVGYQDLTTRYAVWNQYTGDPQSTGRDVFYHDLATGTTHHVDLSYAGYQYDLAAWDHHVVWVGSDIYTAPPFHLIAYDLETGDSTTLLTDERGPPIAWMHGSIVAYTTTRYRTDPDITNRPADVELYDLASGVTRRLTTQPSKLRANRIFLPWLLVVDVLGVNQGMNDWYLMNLAQLGVTDADGRLVPGDPVFEPPQ